MRGVGNAILEVLLHNSHISLPDRTLRLAVKGEESFDSPTNEQVFITAQVIGDIAKSWLIDLRHMSQHVLSEY